MTRLRDVVELRLSRTKRVLDLSGGGWVTGFLHLPDGIETISVRPDELAGSVQPGDLVVDAAPVQSGEDGLLVYVRTIASRLVPGATAVVMTRNAAADLPLEPIERVMGFAGCQLLEIAELAYPEWPAAMVMVGGGADPGEKAPVVAVRGSLARPSIAVPDLADKSGEANAARLRAQIDERDLTIARLNREARTLRSSVRLQLGAALIEAAQKPSAVPRLPVQLVRIWRHRDTGTRSVPTTSVARARTVDAIASEDSQLLAWSNEPVDRAVHPEIFGVVTNPAAEMLSRHSTLRRLVPHEARVALERGLPDFVLIQASALLAPSAWGHAGTPGGAVSYMRTLYDMAVLASSHDVPVVVWQDIRPSMTPALADLTRRADLVIGDGGSAGTEFSWSPGVSLAAFHPTDKHANDKVLVLAERHAGASIEARIRRELDRAGISAVQQPWTPGLADAIRAHGVALLAPSGSGRSTSVSDLTLASIASGSRILSGPNDRLLGEFPSAVVPVNDPEVAASAARELLAMPELSALERRLNLRRIFEYESTPVRLGWLAAALSLRPDPLAERRVTVVIEGANERDNAAAVDNVLSQTHPPARIVVTGERVPDRVLDEARALGVEVAVVHSYRSWQAIAEATDSAWALLWPGTGAATPRGLTHDLLAAAESIRADVVGAGADLPTETYGRFVETLPLEASLIRREHLPRLGSSTDLRALAERGLRLFAVNDAGSDR